MVILYEAGVTCSWLLVRCSSSSVEVKLPDCMLPVKWRMEITYSGLLVMWVSKPVKASDVPCSGSPRPPLGRETVKSLESNWGLLLMDHFPKLFCSLAFQSVWLLAVWVHSYETAKSDNDGCFWYRVMIPCLASSLRVRRGWTPGSN